MQHINIGLLGFGTVGAGVVEGIQRNGNLIAQRTDIQLHVSKIADLDIAKDRGVQVEPSVLTTDAESVVNDPTIDIIVELIGGTSIARELTLKAFKNGKSVITANKALVAEHGDEIYAAANEHHVDLYFEASVGGGIPIIRAIREGLVANHTRSIYGILNGTCNYILTRMEHEALPFDQVLEEAQDAGYAEAEPSLDIDGHDTAHKACILASMAYGFPVAMSDIYVEGIRGFNPTDISYGKELGYRIKLLAIIKSIQDQIEVRVHPALIPLEHTLASVDGVFNAIMVSGDVVGDTLYSGKGAGRQPTASAVIGDIVDVARNIVAHTPRRIPAFVHYEKQGRVKPIDEVCSRYYVRLSLLDRPGTLGQVAQIFGQHEIGIASVIQKETCLDQHVPVIIVTGPVSEKNVCSALAEIRAFDLVDGAPIKIHIEGF
ncbi:MAG: homoserine dehydrogenase [Kiritimatiellae bacterium]|nr:homoserine dehydrogenase [Kiritimatiellia bacterium]